MSSHRPPSAKIPPEIVSEIFVCCLPASPASPNSRVAPLPLSQICARWRDIALDTPELWSNIVLKDDLKASVDILRLWSARARTIPMTFSLETQKVDLGRDMLVAAMEHKERWREVVLHLALRSYGVLGGVSGASLPHLRHLSLRVNRPWGSFRNPGDPPPPTLDLLGASQLRDLRLFRFPYTLRVPWKQLATLHMTDYPTHSLLEALTTLRSCNSLVHLNLYGMYGDNIPAAPEVVHLPHLESLVITNSPIMRHLFLPRLRRLTMPLNHPAVQNVLPLIPKWGCTLETLELTPQAILPQLFPQLLAAIPSLKKLHLALSSRYEADFLSKTMGMLNPEGVLPQFEALRITWHFSSKDDIPEELRGFLHKKALESKLVRVFKSFTLLQPYETSPSERESVLGELKVLSDNEFDIVIRRQNASE
ncbi:hypothetical protein C8F01DRAFT_1306274 [Mycena amicta]|nr:hypothetical protein C8F01DRAFT_1306274 [Mycena amicta]